MQPLTADVLLPIRDELVESFDKDGLRSLVTLAFTYRLEQLVPVEKRTDTQVVEDLILWAVNRRKLARLLAEAAGQLSGANAAPLAALADQAKDVVYYVDVPQDRLRIAREHYLALLELLWPLVTEEAAAGEADRWQRRCRLHYEAALPASAPRQEDGALPALLADLCRYPRQLPDNSLPVVTFVQGVYAEQGAAALRPALDAWVRQIAADAGPVAVPVVQAAPPHAFPTLTVELRLNEADVNAPKRRRYLLEVIYWPPDRTRSATWYPDADAQHTPVTLDQARAVLDGLFSSEAHIGQVATADVERLVLEFAVPFDLLSFPFDEWRPAFLDDSTYGRLQPVIVRPLDRLDVRNPFLRKIYRAAWQAKWALLRRRMHETPVQGHVAWMEEIAAFQRDAFAEQVREDDDLLGVGCATGPPAREVFESWLRAGAPLGLWARPCEGVALPADLRAALGADALLLAGLAEWARKKRIAAAASVAGAPVAAECGRALALLWDDADRIPAKYT